MEEGSPLDSWLVHFFSAKAAGESDLSTRNQQLISLYREVKAFHEQHPR